MSSTRAKTSNLGVVGLLAAAALIRYRIIKRDANGAAAYPTATTEQPYGITVDGSDAAGEEAAVTLLGKGDTKILKMAGTGSRGDKITPAVDGSGMGRAIPSTAGAAFPVVGYADEDWTDGQEIAVRDCAPWTWRNPVAAITAPTGGTTTDAEARTAIGSILSALQAHGISA